jgi:Tol biopolymer transport system component
MNENEEERQLTFDEEMIGWPRWSPDGEHIALQIKRGSDTHVGVVPAEGGTTVQLTNAPGQNWMGAWSPDGEKIAFASWRGDAWNIRWVSRRDKSECQVTDYTALNSFVRYPTWSPLGDQIVYEYAETTGDIWLLERP